MQEHYCQDEDESCAKNGDAQMSPPPPIDIIEFDSSSGGETVDHHLPHKQLPAARQNDGTFAENDENQYDESCRDRSDNRHYDVLAVRWEKEGNGITGEDDSRQTDNIRRGLRILCLIIVILGERSVFCSTMVLL
jgi:hypothetical protein